MGEKVIKGSWRKFWWNYKRPWVFCEEFGIYSLGNNEQIENSELRYSMKKIEFPNFEFKYCLEKEQ